VAGCSPGAGQPRFVFVPPADTATAASRGTGAAAATASSSGSDHYAVGDARDCYRGRIGHVAVVLVERQQRHDRTGYRRSGRQRDTSGDAQRVGDLLGDSDRPGWKCQCDGARDGQSTATTTASAATTCGSFG